MLVLWCWQFPPPLPPLEPTSGRLPAGSNHRDYRSRPHLGRHRSPSPEYSSLPVPHGHWFPLPGLRQPSLPALPVAKGIRSGVALQSYGGLPAARNRSSGADGVHPAGGANPTRNNLPDARCDRSFRNHPQLAFYVTLASRIRGPRIIRPPNPRTAKFMIIVC